jgi:hypothetical protein
MKMHKSSTTSTLIRHIEGLHPEVLENPEVGLKQSKIKELMTGREVKKKKTLEEKIKLVM